MANRGSVLLTFVGPDGSTVIVTISDGVHTVTGMGLLTGITSMTLFFDLSTLTDGTLTVTANATDILLNTISLTTTTTKNTVPPTAPVLTLPAFVNNANRTAVPFTIAGASGTSAAYTVTDGTRVVSGGGTIGAGGSLALSLDLSTLADGPVTARATLTDPIGNTSGIGTATATKNSTGPSATVAVTSVTVTMGGVLWSKTKTIQFSVVVTDSSPATSVAFSTDGTTFGAAQAFTATPSYTVTGADGLYTIYIKITDAASNSIVVTKVVRIDTTAPVITSSPGSGQTYNLGSKFTFTYSASDLGCTCTVTAVLDNTTNISSGAQINVDTLTVGLHTIKITAVDSVGNVSTLSITFTVAAQTVQGLMAAVTDGQARGLITAQEAMVLQSQLTSVTKGNSGRIKLQQFIYMVQGERGKSINAAYADLLVNWANDLMGRL